MPRRGEPGAIAGTARRGAYGARKSRLGHAHLLIVIELPKGVVLLQLGASLRKPSNRRPWRGQQLLSPAESGDGAAASEGSCMALSHGPKKSNAPTS
jgi:hypothetical protein